VVARAPSYNWTALMGAFNRNAKALAAPGGQLSNAQVAMVAKAVRDTCDALDGLGWTASSPRIPGGVLAGLLSRHALPLSPPRRRRVQATSRGRRIRHVFRKPQHRNARGWSLHRQRGTNPHGVAGNGRRATKTTRGSLQYASSDTTVKNYLARDPDGGSRSPIRPYDTESRRARRALAQLQRRRHRPDLGRLSRRARPGKAGSCGDGGTDAALSVHFHRRNISTSIAQARGLRALLRVAPA
jgi:feruloyl esterase